MSFFLLFSALLFLLLNLKSLKSTFLLSFLVIVSPVWGMIDDLAAWVFATDLSDFILSFFMLAILQLGLFGGVFDFTVVNCEFKLCFLFKSVSESGVSFSFR